MGVDRDFDAFVQSRSAGLVRMAYLLTYDRGHAEDLVQSALLRTLRHWRRVRNAPDAYARKVLLNLALDRRRSLRRRPAEFPLPDGDAAHPPDLSAAGMGDRVMLSQALTLLPVRQRQVVVLRFYADLSVADAADLLGCSVGTVKSTTAKALARLRELLGEVYTEEEPCVAMTSSPVTSASGCTPRRPS
ncbi:MAG TPA: SigE family RNA polymerase sigma factor [Pilimelia sp.]|nr:SigE family RNA polymerase sigma factor [Pilimelia sp.]